MTGIDQSGPSPMPPPTLPFQRLAAIRLGKKSSELVPGPVRELRIVQELSSGAIQPGGT